MNITKTIKGTSAVVLCVDLIKQEAYTETVNVAGRYKDKKKLLKYLETIINNDEKKVINIKSTEFTKTTYSCRIEEFIKISNIITTQKGELK